ncbi:hypothetical protein SAY86_018679 [Trapa natans]|uniref:Uncharacterized protein n=1 Tax=Trapa natans TaxID=22666 RepID=A0AAN7LNP4_TRANT|nr:hypothetical protein SAY86_018679 [Trapa natans]
MLVAPPVIAFGILVQYECFETIRSECVENGTDSQAQRLSVQPEFSQDAVFLLRFSFRGSYVEYLQIDRSIEGGQDGRETKTMENCEVLLILED